MWEIRSNFGTTWTSHSEPITYPTGVIAYFDADGTSHQLYPGFFNGYTITKIA